MARLVNRPSWVRPRERPFFVATDRGSSPVAAAEMAGRHKMTVKNTRIILTHLKDIRPGIIPERVLEISGMGMTGLLSITFFKMVMG